MKASDPLTIGALAARTGLSVSAIRFYEAKGLVTPSRNAGGHRRFLRSDIRRLSFVTIAQGLGFSIEDIRRQLSRLPQARTPTQKDWALISREFKRVLDEQIGAVVDELARRFLGDADDRTIAEWIVRAPEGTGLPIEIAHGHEPVVGLRLLQQPVDECRTVVRPKLSRPGRRAESTIPRPSAR